MLHNAANVLNATEFVHLKQLILYYVNITSINYFLKKADWMISGCLCVCSITSSGFNFWMLRQKATTLRGPQHCWHRKGLPLGLFPKENVLISYLKVAV